MITVIMTDIGGHSYEWEGWKPLPGNVSTVNAIYCVVASNCELEYISTFFANIIHPKFLEYNPETIFTWYGTEAKIIAMNYGTWDVGL